MGTYTTNYNLFMPTIGETGWGTLVNGNFTTIDTTMKRLDTRITAVENEVNGNLSCTSVTATTGTFAGAVTGASFNGATITSDSFNGIKITKQLTPFKMYLSTRVWNETEYVSIPTYGIQISSSGYYFPFIFGTAQTPLYAHTPSKTVKSGWSYLINNAPVLIHDVEILDGSYNFVLENSGDGSTYKTNVNGYGEFTTSKTISFEQAKTLLTSVFDIKYTATTSINPNSYINPKCQLVIKNLNSGYAYAFITRG